MTKPANLLDSLFSRKDSVASLAGTGLIVPLNISIDQATGKFNRIGFDQPNAAPVPSTAGAGPLTGLYTYSVVFLDPVTGQFGEGSTPIAIATVANDVLLTFAHSLPTDTRATEMRVFRTLADGFIAFKLVDLPVAQATFTDSITDATIDTNQTLPVGLSAYRKFEPNSFGWIFRHAEFLLAGDSADYHDDASEFKNKVGFTVIDPIAGPMPQAWALENQGVFPDDEHMRSGTGLGDHILIFAEGEIWLWNYIDNPHPEFGRARIEPLNVGRGAITFKSVINTDGDVFVMDRRGFYQYRGGQSTLDLTDAVRGVFDRINWNQVAQFHGSFDNDRIIWWFALDGEDECHHSLSIDRRALQRDGNAIWWLSHYPMGIRDSTNYIQGNSAKAQEHGHANQLRIEVFTKEGFKYIVDQNTPSDGVHPNITRAGTIAFDNNQIFQPVNAPTLLGLSDLSGCYVMFEGLPGQFEIDFSNGTNFTLVDPLGITLFAGHRFVVGGIETLWRSGMVEVGGPQSIKSYRKMGVLVEPLAADGSIRVATKHDHLGEFLASAGRVGKERYTIDIGKPGVRMPVGGKATDGNRKGYMRVPISGTNSRQLQVEFSESNVETTFLPWKLLAFFVESTPEITD